MKLFHFVIYIFLLLPLDIRAQSFSILTDEGSAKHTGSYYEFSSDIQKIDQAIESLRTKKNYQEHKKIIRKFSKKPIWYAFTVKNNLDESIERIIQYPIASTSLMEVFEVNKDYTFQKTSIKHTTPKQKRIVKMRRLATVIKLKAKEEKLIFVKLKSFHQISANFDIYPLKEAQGYEEKFMVLSLLYVGLALSLFIYNLFVGFNTGNKFIQFFVLVLITQSMMIITISDVPIYFSLILPGWIHASIPLLRALMIFSMTVFTITFLDVKKNLPMTNLLFKSFAFIALIVGALSYFDSSYNLVNVILKNLGTLNLIMISALAFYITYKSKSRPKLIFTMGTLTFFISGIVYVLTMNYGVIPRNFTTINIILIGSAFEMILFSLAIADDFKEKMSRELSSRKKAEAQLVNLNTFLEKKIKEKSDQLFYSQRRAALGELSTSIAHEMNSPLSAVFNGLQYQTRLLDRNEIDQEKILSLCQKNIKIMNEVFVITEKLKLFGQNYGEDAKEDLNIDHAIKIILDRFKGNAYYNGNSNLRIKTHKLYFFNAVTALLDVSFLLNDTSFLTVAEQSGNIIIEISGTNNLVPQWIQNYIELPFFEQDGDHKGSGLELSLAKDSIDALGGKIIVSHGDEFIFKILLPIQMSEDKDQLDVA